MTTFKFALTTIFLIGTIVGVVVFALSKVSSTGSVANLVVWGTVSNQVFDTAYEKSSLHPNKSIQISYVRKDVGTFDSDFVEALAEGAGPDIVILRDDSVYKNRSKLIAIPYKNYSERDFKDQFVEEAELFLSEEGIIAVPLTIDPLVMYWNRDIFGNNLIPKPPQYWDEIPQLVDKITRRDSGANILQSTVAFGEWHNVTNAKEIIAMLLLQAGTPITSRSPQGVRSVLNLQFDYPIKPSQSAMNFYTQFSNPVSQTYTWNRSLPSSSNFFLSGNLAMYIGFASEIFSIQQKNSNLNFDVTYVPQIRDAPKKTVFAHMYSLAIVKQSKQASAALLAIKALTEPESIRALESVTNLPPLRRDLLADKPTDAFRIVFYNSALISRSWIDPNATESSNTFRDMIGSITSGRSRLLEALDQADNELSAQLRS